MPLIFDSIDDIVVCQSGADVNNIATVSISLWFRPDSFGEISFGRVFDKNASVKAWYLASGGNYVGSMGWVHGFSTTLGEWRGPSGMISSGVWTHMVVTYDNGATTNDPILYKNGVSQAITEISTPVGTASADAAGTMMIGNRAAGDRTFDGGIAEVAVWNAILTSAQVQDLTNGASPLAVASTSLVRYYPLWGKNSEEPNLPQHSGRIGSISGAVHAGPNSGFALGVTVRAPVSWWRGGGQRY